MAQHEAFAGTESERAALGPSTRERSLGPNAAEPRITFRKAVVRREDGSGVVAQVFTMSIGQETIQLVPCKSWAQMDTYKWRARGILPGTPLGLEVKWEQVKLAGETVSPWDSDACERLERALNGWLVLEKQKLELSKGKGANVAPAPTSPPDEESVCFRVERGATGQLCLKCLEGGSPIKTVAVNLPGLTALVEQGLMRKPRAMKVGPLQSWVELDGEIFRFGDGTNGDKELELALNERYLPAHDPNAAQDVQVLLNPASPTGFDIQFPASPSGVFEIRKRHLNEEALGILQDSEKCRVLRKGITAKLAPPNLVFKLKTADGGESYFPSGPERTVSIEDEGKQVRTIDLSQPVNLLNVGARELTAVFNHPAINRRARLAELAKAQPKRSENAGVPGASSQAQADAFAGTGG